MTSWTRDEPWRQGHILSPGFATAQGLICPEEPGATATVVISHDCDIASLADLEPTIDVIVGQFKAAIQGDFAHGKNVRKLHLPYGSDTDFKIVELRSIRRMTIAKELLVGQVPLTNFTLSTGSRRVLQKWLGARYDRSAFPTEFELRLERHRLPEQISKILKQKGQSIRGIYFDLGDQADTELMPLSEPYELEIYLLYTTEPDADAAERDATEIQTKLRSVFKARCFEKTVSWDGIELVDCYVISDQAMTVHLASKLRQWRMDHMSLRTDPNQPMAE